MSSDNENEESTKINNELIVRDIDLPLYKYGLIHRIDINFYLENQNKKSIQKIKSNALIILLFFHTIRHIFYWVVSKNGRVPDIYLDITQYIEGFPQFNRAITVISGLFSLSIVFIFNYSRHMEWVEIIESLKGIRRIDQFISFDNELMNKFVVKIKFMKSLIRFITYFNIFGLTLKAIKAGLSFHDWNLIMTFGVINILLYLPITYFVTFTVFYAFLYFYIVCHYCKMRFKSFHKFIDKVNQKQFFEYRVLNEIVNEYNDICNTIIKYNKFWKNYYFVLNYTLIPINLMLLHQSLFENIHSIILLTLILTNICCLAIHLVFNTIMASVNKESTKSFKYLQRFYLNIVSLINNKQKIQVSFSK